MKLDENQRKAVEHFEGPALVVAGPGSGKTTVIIKRILNLVHKHNVDPENILAIAFTNAAADEMEDRLRKTGLNGSEPTICTLHVFGRDLVTKYYEQAGFNSEPNNIWDDKEIQTIIRDEKKLLDQETREAIVSIYKIKDKTTHQHYIGQTIDPDRRKEEHFNHSSNRGLREAIQQKGKEYFDFEVIETVEGGAKAYAREEFLINSYRNSCVINLAQGVERIPKKSSDALVVIYKIKSLIDATAYIGYTTNPESIQKIIENSGTERFTFEIIHTEVLWAKASIHIANEIKKHKDWAMFNRQDPQKARYSNQLRIEMFCQHFNVCYDEVLESPEKFENLKDKFDNLKKEVIEREKQQTVTGVFKPNEITDPILRAFAIRYENRKEEAGALDFLDMLILSANMLENDPDLLREYQKKYRYVFVDEFQDISPIDFRLIDLFPENLFAVGDDDQAIYGFRGGDSSIMQEKFGKRGNVTHYEITRNYRSTSTIVRHAKALIEHNSLRIPKNLRSQKSARSRIEVLKTSRDTVERTSLDELLPIVTACETHFKENTPDLDNPLWYELTVSQQIGILSRNWYEVQPIQTYLKSKLENKGFKICWSDSDAKEKRKLVVQRGAKKIEISTIHSAKGREWDKVILLVNNQIKAGPDQKPIPSIPDPRNAVEDERRLFYVAVTRAKQELVILDGGNCEFVPEFQNVPLTKVDIEHTFREELAKQESQLKKDLEKSSTEALTEFQHKLKNEVRKTSNTVQKQNEVKLNRLCDNITGSENATTKLETKLPIALKTANKNLLEDLISVLDEFETLSKDLPDAAQSNNTADYMAFTKSVQLAEKQLQDSLENHGLKPIEVSMGDIFNPVYHEEISSAIYSDEVPTGRVARSERRGYLLDNQIGRKAQVVISKKKQKVDALLTRDFAQPVRFGTYKGFCDLRNIEVFKDEVKGFNSQGREIQLHALNTLFAFPKEDMASLKSHIKIRRPIANQNLQPIKIISEKYHVADDTLKSLLIKQETLEFEDQNPTVQCITRSGHVLNGHLSDFDEDFLYMHVNKKTVIVYRNGILELKNLTWDRIESAYRNGTTINGYIIARVTRGFTVRFQLLDGFLPESEVALQRIRNLDSYVGRALEMKIIQISTSRNRIVFSHRAWLEELRTQLLNTLEVGQTITGPVKNIRDFGAFVDIGGVDGLLHKSEITWKRISHPSEIVSVGEDIEVKVIEFDRENEKISLSLKRLTSDPWENAEERYPVGSAVRGIVVNIVNYGAFVQLEEGIDGLIHISEMPTDSRHTLPSDIINRGDTVEVLVIRISEDSRRISLRMIASLPIPVENPQSPPTPDIPMPTEKIERMTLDDPPEPMTITLTEHTEDTLPVPDESSFDGETNATTPYEPINPTDTQPIEETSGISPPMSEEFSAILNSQIQNLKPEPIKTETSLESCEIVSDNSQPTPQESNEILKTHIQNLKPVLPEEHTNPPSDAGNDTSGQLIEPIYSEPLEQTSSSSLSIETLHEEVQKDESQSKQKKLEHHLVKFGRFVLRKLKEK